MKAPLRRISIFQTDFTEISEKYTHMNNVTIRCKNTDRTHSIAAGSTLEQLLAAIGLPMPHGCTSAKVNNKVEGLHYALYNDKDVEFLDITSPSGLRTYTRSLFFVLYKAVHDLMPEAQLRIDTPVSNGYYCRIDMPDNTAPADCAGMAPVLLAKMRELVAADLPFHRITCPAEEAVALFRQHGMEDKAMLLEGCGTLYTHYYTLDGTPDYFYGSLLVRTGQLSLFDLVPYADGMLLRVPDPSNPMRLMPMVEQPKMFEIFREQHRWQQILGISTIGQLNKANREGMSNDIINVSEALQEKRIARLAETIAAQPAKRVILIAGPSSSGKTTFSKRLATQLWACGKKPVAIELDNYFVDRELTPVDEHGEYDFEHIGAMNMKLLNEQLNALLRGEEVQMPRYNFQTGKSEPDGRRLRLTPDMLLILEGIHALNPQLTADIAEASKYRIYASALTTIMLDHHNYVPTTDNRLLRRIVRDYKYRGCSAADTIRRWPSVRAGEKRWIFPYQEEADAMFNTALLFELSALREQALPLLEQVDERDPEYAEAYRLRKFLGYLSPISSQALPPTSLLREFLGGSTFHD